VARRAGLTARSIVRTVVGMPGDVEMVRCAACGTANRVPRAKLQQGLRPVCGRCKATLAAAPAPLAVTDANFAELVGASPLPVLLDVWAPWCGPCRAVAPIVEELARELSGRVRVGKLNVDDNPATAARFGARSIPTLLILRAGREIDRIVGAVPKQEILRHLAAVL
jgi:thioredoxin 2